MTTSNSPTEIVERPLRAGAIVYATCVPHVGAILRDPAAVPDRSARLDAAWALTTEELLASAPDAIVVVATDHYETFHLQHHPSFCVGIGDTYEGWAEFGNPGGTVVGDAQLATELLTALVAQDFDMSRSHDIRLDHSFMVPLVRLGLTHLPVVPLYVNCNTPPLPSLRRCHALGLAIANAAAELPSGSRLAVLGTGGMSHWVGLPRFGDINERWDREVLDRLSSGDVTDILTWSDGEIETVAGNGALELRTWLVAHAASGATGGEVLAYEPMTPWAIGAGIMRMGST